MNNTFKNSVLSISAIILLSGCTRTEDLIGNLDPYQFISEKYKKVESVVKSSFITEEKEEINVNQDTQEFRYPSKEETAKIEEEASKYKSFEFPTQDIKKPVVQDEEILNQKFNEKYVNFKEEPKTELEKQLNFKFPKSRKYSIMEVDLKSGYDGYPYRIVEINSGNIINGVIFSTQKDLVKVVGTRQVKYSEYDYYVNVVDGVAKEFYTHYVSPMKKTKMIVDSQMKFTNNLTNDYKNNCKEFVTNFVARNEVVGQEITKFEYKNGTFYKNSVELTINDPYLPGLEKSLDTICLDATKKLFNIR